MSGGSHALLSALFTNIQSTRPRDHKRSPICCLVIPSELFLPITGRSAPGCSSRFSPTHQGSSRPPQITRLSSVVGANRSRRIKRLSFISEVVLQLFPVTLSFHAVCRCKLGKVGGRGGGLSAGQLDQNGSYLGLGNGTSVRGICTCCWEWSQGMQTDYRPRGMTGG